MNTYLRGAAAASCLVLATTMSGVAFADDDRKKDHERAEMSAQADDMNVSAARKESQISTTISLNRQLRASDVEVSVDGNTATLTGTVDDEVNKQLAADLAMNADGIDDVDNQLEVDTEYTAEARERDGADAGERSFGDRVDDATTTAAVKGRLMWSRHAEAFNTDVDTENGVVTLSGAATTEEAKQAAEELARETGGVRTVRNELEVDPDLHDDAGATSLAQAGPTGTVTGGDEPIRDSNVQANRTEDEDSTTAVISETVSDAWITTKVKSSFLTSRWIAGTDIDVDTDDGVVNLSGEVGNEDEKTLAVEMAEDIRGVREVRAEELTIG